jgi:hypothetical protein
VSLIWPSKDPDNVADYNVDWTDRLNVDTISTSTFTLVTAAGLTIDDQDSDGALSTVWLSAGTAGLTGRLLCRITTGSGRTYDEEIALDINGGLVVEDGTGLATAEAFASVETADAYCAKHRLTWSGTTNEKESALRRAAGTLNTNWRYKGERTNGRDQALAFPRAECTDAEDVELADDEVPIEVVYANIELAVYELANPGASQPSFVMADRPRRERVGPIEVEYAATPYTPEASRPTFLRVEDLLAGFLSGGSGLSGSTTR